jgi:hypothetical protein
LSFSLRPRGHGEAFDDHVVQVAPEIGFKVFRVFSTSATNSGILQRFQKSRLYGPDRSTPGGIA